MARLPRPWRRTHLGSDADPERVRQVGVSLGVRQLEDPKRFAQLRLGLRPPLGRGEGLTEVDPADGDVRVVTPQRRRPQLQRPLVQRHRPFEVPEVPS